MCACNFKLGTTSQLSGNYPVVLSAQNIADNKTKEIMLCIYHTSPSKFKDSFNKILVKGEPLIVDDENGVITLANLHDTGEDAKLFGINFLERAKMVSETFTQEELDNASCTIALSIN